jgi:hypothetical protein
MDMEVFLLVAAVFLMSMAGLAAGAMARRAPLRGSCGGLACRCRGKCGNDNQPEGMDHE